MSDSELVVIGGGEAGIAAALRGAQLGARVRLIDREPELGAACVRLGATAEDIKSMTFNHPTVSEGFAKAAAEAARHPLAAGPGPGPKAG